jgi:DNA-binding transcriptional ArsR family regulator
MEDELTALQARICKVLAHPKRLQIVYALRAGERSVGELAKELQLPYANLSQHLRILLEIGLVEVRHHGRYSYYRLADPAGRRGVRSRAPGAARALDTLWQVGSCQQ